MPPREVPSREEIARRRRAYRDQALAAFPFERQEVAGEQALDAWEQLKRGGRGVPVVVGDDASLEGLASLFGPGSSQMQDVSQTLEAAGHVRYPEDLARHQAAEREAAVAKLKAMAKPRSSKPIVKLATAALRITGLLRSFPGADPTTLSDDVVDRMLQDHPPALGDWPAQAESFPTLGVAVDFDGKPIDKAHIILVPTDDWTTVPAHLRWGGANACPPAEFHVAALRSWRDRFGAELVGLGPDRMCVRLQRLPKTREAALDLAREHFGYCEDLVYQGFGALRPLAAALMQSDWWDFWWD